MKTTEVVDLALAASWQVLAMILTDLGRNGAATAPPDAAGDGLLSASEAAHLDLVADWVILSVARPFLYVERIAGAGQTPRGWIVRKACAHQRWR